jgi:hypothetical protein
VIPGLIVGIAAIALLLASARNDRTQTHDASKEQQP